MSKQAADAGADAGAEAGKQAAEDATANATDSLAKAIADLKSQLEAQTRQLEALQVKYEAEVKSREQGLEKQRKLISEQETEISAQRQATKSLQQQVDQMSTAGDKKLTDDEKAMRTRMETVESSIKASQQAESTQYNADSFPGSFPIPGTSAAIRVGGYVKMNIVESFTPIGSKDRFIVGSIPVPKIDGPTEASLTVDQTRMNLDLRDTTKKGPLRAFVEADFAGEGNTLRLRHAFGQFNNILAGQTWSTFMDYENIPEDLDFEGINGRILVRQPQIRYFPTIGQNLHLLASIEDPNPQITGGTGISQIPDLVISIRRTWFNIWEVKTALLLRQIDGTCDCLDGQRDSTVGWGLTFSGKTELSLWDKRDNVMFQINYGSGYGRYVNDLANIGGQDAVFNEQTGELSPLPVLSWYAVMQKWWGPTFRSNFNLGYVDIHNLNFQEPDAYNKTYRMSANIIWSPTPRVDLGVETLYGKRQNKNGESANAGQLQVSGTYRY